MVCIPNTQFRNLEKMHFIQMFLRSLSSQLTLHTEFLRESRVRVRIRVMLGICKTGIHSANKLHSVVGVMGRWDRLSALSACSYSSKHVFATMFVQQHLSMIVNSYTQLTCMHSLSGKHFLKASMVGKYFFRKELCTLPSICKKRQIE